MGRGRPVSRRAVRSPRPGRGARRPSLPRPVRRPRAWKRGRPPGDPVGRGLARGGDGDRPHRAGRRPGGLRAGAGARPAGALARRRGGPLLRRLRLAARDVDERGRRPDRRPPGRAGLPPRGGHDPPPLSALLALRHAAHLACDGRLADRGGRPAPDAARRERDGRMDAGLHGQAHGRLAAQHGRLEHLPAPLLRASASVLPVRLRAPERDRLEGGAPGARDRAGRGAGGAPAAVDRRRSDPLRGLRRRDRADRGGGRRLARRGHRPVLDARLGEPRARPGGLRDRRGEGAHARRPARPRVLGGVVPRRLGLGDARADSPVVLLAALHVGRR